MHHGQKGRDKQLLVRDKHHWKILGLGIGAILVRYIEVALSGKCKPLDEVVYRFPTSASDHVGRLVYARPPFTGSLRRVIPSRRCR